MHIAKFGTCADARPVLAALAGAGAAAAAAQGQLLALAGALELAHTVAAGRSGGGAARPATLQFAEDDAPRVNSPPSQTCQDRKSVV